MKCPESGCVEELVEWDDAVNHLVKDHNYLASDVEMFCIEWQGTHSLKQVFTAIPKELHFAKDHVARFVVEEGNAPITPYAYPFWMLDTVPREQVRQVNNKHVKECDELWVFDSPGELGSDGVVEEVKLANQLNKPVKWFNVELDGEEEPENIIEPVSPKDLDSVTKSGIDE